jgi:hypothetical protein
MYPIWTLSASMLLVTAVPPRNLRHSILLPDGKYFCQRLPFLIRSAVIMSAAYGR